MINIENTYSASPAERNSNGSCDVSQIRCEAWRSSVAWLYENKRRELIRTFLKTSRDIELAHDALHESFARLLQQSPENIHAPMTWLRRVGVNWLLDQFRRRSRHPTGSLGPEHTDHCSEDPAYSQVDEQRHRVRKALKQLCEKDRFVLVAKYGLKWSAKKIAIAADSTPQAVDMRICRARKKLTVLLMTSTSLHSGA